jgi:aspartyl-tRNA(Asn)/glutamyl-tRNA(Gln) amidotransferase subunit A
MFLKRFQSSSRAAAEAADVERAAGSVRGPLHGIPVGIKDVISTSEGPTSGQSLVDVAPPLMGDAVVTWRLRSAGAIILGKLSTMEMACGAPDADKPFPIPRNPWLTERWAGGSSSGSGSAVATGAVLGALGTDTGGSIRVPAAYCGITGLKPTFGRVPKSGTIPLSHSLDHVGPMARSARGCAMLLNVLAGPDQTDPSASPEPVDDYSATLTGDLTGVRIGVDRLDRISGDDEDPAVPELLAAAVEVLRSRGASVVSLELPYYEEMSALNKVIMACEGFAHHRAALQGRWRDFGAPTRLFLSIGAMYTAADLVQAQRARAAGRRALERLFRHVDLVITPTVAAGAVRLDELTDKIVKLRMPTFTGYWDSAGTPALSVPMGFTADGLPLGLQICGRPFEEGLVLRAGDAYQQDTDWHLRLPPVSVHAGARGGGGD